MSVLIELHYNEFNMSDITFLYTPIQLLAQLVLLLQGIALAGCKNQD